MSKNKVFVRVMAVLLAVILAGSLLVGVISSVRASAVTQSDIDALEEKQSAIKDKQEEIKKELSSLEYQQSSAMDKKAVLDEQVENTQEGINNLNDQIDKYEKLIEDKEVEVQEAEKAEAEQWEKYEVRLRAMEENGTISYFSVIFGATSFSDLLSRIDFVSEVIKYDEDLYDQVVAAKEATQKAKADLEETKSGMETAKADLETEKEELEGQLSEAQALIDEINSNIDEYEKIQADYEAEAANIESQISDKVAELERQQEEAKKRAEEEKKNSSGDSSNGGSSSDGSSGNITTGTGRFIWPSYTTYITSPYGWRTHPIYGTRKLHKGTDIGASYGTEVWAADSGTVITSEYSSSYGNYVVIYHGDNTSTLYAHMSSRAVSVGESVSQGQTIGYVGSTGNSTGAHLHFEVYVNGSTVDPMSFF